MQLGESIELCKPATVAHLWLKGLALRVESKISSLDSPTSQGSLTCALKEPSELSERTAQPYSRTKG